MADTTYISRYSGDKRVSAAQYITEIICEHKALKDKKDLHFRFWLSKEWAKFFRDQIASANKLLKKYPSKAIIKALNSPKGIKIYSLRAPHLPAIIDESCLQIEKDNNKKSNNDISRKDIQNYSLRKSNSSTNNILSKLRNLDNGS